MSEQVKNLTSVAKDIKDLGNRASTIRQDLSKNLSDAHEALDIAQDLSTALRNTTAELRGALGLTSNNPPEPPAKEPKKP